jgi:hypothetical protein
MATKSHKSLAVGAYFAHDNHAVGTAYSESATTPRSNASQLFEAMLSICTQFARSHASQFAEAMLLDLPPPVVAEKLPKKTLKAATHFCAAAPQCSLCKTFGGLFS